MSKEIIYNAHIITMNASLDIIRQGSILIENGIIKAISSAKITENNARYTDAHGMFILPGLINSHCHIPMTMLRGFADDLPLEKWLMDYIFPAEAQFVNSRNVKVATRLGLLEMIKSGTTCFNDMYFFEDTIGEEVKKSGMRAVLGEAILDFPTPSFKTVDGGLNRTVDLIQRWKSDPTIHVSVCPHSTYTCSKETLQKTKELADKYQTLLHIHLSETRTEVNECIKKTGLSPVQYLNEIGLLDANLMAAHCVWLNSEDISLMASKHASIGHCPKSNLKLASGIANCDDYIKSGITLSIGTDGTASNNNLDMVEEMRIASLLSKVKKYDPEAMNARQMVKAATIDGAKALGLANLTGSIEKGKQADLIVIDQTNTNMCPIYDEYSAIVYAMNSHNVISSMVHGRWIMKNRIVQTVDEEDTLDRIHSIADRIRRK